MENDFFKKNLKEDFENIKTLEDLKEFLFELIPNMFIVDNLLTAQIHSVSSALLDHLKGVEINGK